jgi:hypothetical protein
MFGVAHYRIVGDAAEVLPMIIKALRDRTAVEGAPEGAADGAADVASGAVEGAVE